MTDQTTYWKHPVHRDAFKLARSITARYARSFYLSAQLLPARKRWATYGLYGFCRHVDNLVDEPGDFSPSQVRNQLCGVEDALTQAYQAGSSPDPIIHAYIQVAQRHEIPPHLPHELVEGVRMDIGECRYQTYADLYTYCYRVAGVVGLMMTHVLGHHDPGAFKHAEELGVAMQLTNILRDVDEDRLSGRLYLPIDEMDRFGVTEQDILEGQMSESLRDLMQFQSERSHAGYESAEPGIDMLDRDARFAIRSASRIYRGILGKIETRGYDPFQGRVYIPGRSKARIVIREALRSSLPISLRSFRPNHS